MTNKGINEQLLEDMKEIVESSKDYNRWRISALEQPDPNKYQTILVTGEYSNCAYVLIYDSNKKKWIWNDSAWYEIITDIYWKPHNKPN